MNTQAIIEKKIDGKVVGYNRLVVKGEVSHRRIEILARQAFGPGACVESGSTKAEPGQYDVSR